MFSRLLRADVSSAVTFSHLLPRGCGPCPVSAVASRCSRHQSFVALVGPGFSGRPGKQTLRQTLCKGPGKEAGRAGKQKGDGSGGGRGAARAGVAGVRRGLLTPQSSAPTCCPPRVPFPRPSLRTPLAACLAGRCPGQSQHPRSEGGGPADGVRGPGPESRL